MFRWHSGRSFSHVAIVALAVILPAPAALSAAQRGEDLVRAELLSNVAAVQPGKPFLVGVRLKIEPHWHIYWITPGDSGLATKVKLSLPQGFSAGQVRFPAPVKFVQPGDVVGYGYKEEVMLLSEITPPADLPAGSSQKIEARVSWLVCQDICLPGKQAVTLTLPVAGAADEARPLHTDLFETWSSQIPENKAWQDAGGAVQWSQRDDAAIATIDWPADVKDVQFFPSADPAVEIRDVTIRPESPRRTRIEVPVHVRKNQAPKNDHLPAVVAFTNADGQRRAIELAVPMPKPASAETARSQQ